MARRIISDTVVTIVDEKEVDVIVAGKVATLLQERIASTLAVVESQKQELASKDAVIAAHEEKIRQLESEKANPVEIGDI
jgi:hypothetical protein